MLQPLLWTFRLTVIFHNGRQHGHNVGQHSASCLWMSIISPESVDQIPQLLHDGFGCYKDILFDVHRLEVHDEADCLFLWIDVILDLHHDFLLVHVHTKEKNAELHSTSIQ
jgi:hypothetical protein